MTKKHTKRDIYYQVTDQMIALLERGVSPWSCPWDRSGEWTLPVNHSTDSFYQGINIPLLWMEQEQHGFSSSRWMTYQQAAAMSGQVRKGEKGSMIIFFKPWEKGTGENDADGHEIVEHIPMLRSFTVFNLDQIDGLDVPEQAPLTGGFNPIEAAESVLAASGVTIHEAGTQAFYRPSTDEITLPERERFTSAEDFYATTLHELTHATQAKSRCDRTPYETQIKNGSKAFEELVAELGAAFSMAWLGLPGTVKDHASYIDSWMSVLKADKKAFFRAAAQAQKAHEWIKTVAEPHAIFAA